MFSRITRFQVADGKEKELVNGYNATLEHVKAQKGFLEAILMIDADGNAVSVTFWDTKENLDASGKTTPGSVIEKILPMVRPYQKAPPVSTPFSVKLRVK